MVRALPNLTEFEELESKMASRIGRLINTGAGNWNSNAVTLTMLGQSSVFPIWECTVDNPDYTGTQFVRTIIDAIRSGFPGVSAFTWPADFLGSQLWQPKHVHTCLRALGSLKFISGSVVNTYLTSKIVKELAHVESTSYTTGLSTNGPKYTWKRTAWFDMAPDPPHCEEDYTIIESRAYTLVDTASFPFIGSGDYVLLSALNRYQARVWSLLGGLGTGGTAPANANFLVADIGNIAGFHAQSSQSKFDQLGGGTPLSFTDPTPSSDTSDTEVEKHASFPAITIGADVVFSCVTTATTTANVPACSVSDTADDLFANATFDNNSAEVIEFPGS